MERAVVSQRILFSKIKIMPKGQFPKIKGIVCNIPIETEEVCNVLPRTLNESNVIFMKLKRKLCYNGHVLSEAVRPEVVFSILNHLKNVNPLYQHINIQEILSENAFDIRFVDDKDVDFSIIGDESIESSTEIVVKFVDDEDVQKICNFGEGDEFENDDPMDQHRLACVETTLISKCPHAIVDDENIVVAPGEGKAPLNILKDTNVEVLAFPDLFPNGKFGLTAYRDVKLTHTKYFNQRLLNYTQRFASDTDYIFFANFVSQQTNLQNQMNVAMRKVSGRNISAGMLSSNFKEAVKNFVVSEEAYSFMNTVKGSAAYWKSMLSDVLAMVKQLGMPSFFMTLSCADLRWNELPYIISKLNGQELLDEEISEMPYFERCKLLNSNPVILARHFQYRVEVFYKHIVINGPLGKVKFHVIRIEFQFRGSPHAHCLIWVENMPTLSLDTVEEYTQFLDSVISANIPTESSKLKILVEQYQVHRHSRTCKKYGNKECRFGFGKFFTHRTIIAKPLPADTPDKDQILLKQKELLSKVKKYIDEFLNPQKRNFLYPQKPNYEEMIPDMNEVLESLDISLDEYENALSISTDENDFQVHLKRGTNSCFVNNYFDEGLLAWQANIDLQPVFNHYKAVQYMCAYFSKNETSSSNAMKEALAECKELDKDKFETMRKLAQAYSDNRECSVQEAVYQLMPELWLRKGYPQVMFVNTNLPEDRFHMFKSEEELSELPEDSEDVFKKNILDRYIDRPNITFSNGKYREIDYLCYAQFCSNYELDKKIDYAELINDNQPNVLDDSVVEENHVENTLPKKIPLMNSKECLRCRKARKVLRTYTPNRHLYPEKYAHHLLMLFYPFRKEEDLKLDGSYVLKLSDPDVLEKVNRNREIFEPNSEMVEMALQNYRNDLLTNQNSFSQQEDDEVFELLNEELDNNTEVEEEPHIEDLANLAPAAVRNTALSEEELRLNIESLNEKQREIFDVVYMSIKRYIQNKNLESPEALEPLRIFLTAAGGCGKSYLLKCLYDVLNKLLCRKGDASKAKILRLAPTGVAAINIDGTTIHTGLGLSRHGFLPLSDKQRTNFRLKLQDVSVIFIDEISMVSPQTLLQIHQRLCEIFGLSDRIPFANKTVIVSGDLYQLPPVFGGPVFKLNGFLINLMKLWREFKFAELNKVMRQQGDNTFVNLLNNIRVGIMTEEDERILKSKLISQADPNYPWDALHLFAENSMVKAHNDIMIETLLTPVIDLFAIEQYPRGLVESKIQEIRNKNYTDTGGIPYKLTLRVGARVLLTTNVDINDRLVNGQLGTVKHIKVLNGRCEKIYVLFDDVKAGNEKRKNDDFARRNGYVPIERTEAKFGFSKRKEMVTVVWTQFPLILAYACTVHKVQGLTLQKIVVSFQLHRQNQFKPGQMYVALSRVTSLDGLFLIGNYSSTAIISSKPAEEEYQRLRCKENVLEPLVSFYPSDENLVLTLLNIRSLRRKSASIRHFKELSDSDVLFFTETQISHDSSVEEIEYNIRPFKMLFNNVEDKFKSLAVGYRESVTILEDQHVPGFSLVTLKKSVYSTKKYKILLLYRSHQETLGLFFNQLSMILNEEPNIDIIMGDFNIDLLKVKKLKNYCISLKILIKL
ncbi:uncharacterized protein [Clytia hemisphaerica]|uniref:uncharacterized protein n=1 Tax=Clytia hemisphaerica TaxID=252671 RepID=UPI0034D549F1